ncbi:pentatricopeptide repeat-containing protein At4g18520, chloroplastic-like [Benincasa hispida]|uniref:pentatricopeptide repeat-containing protein At4g18520, chloroplastic-like n=1 Tax=Benincasa hispida TaxID=102211 RepID=UPI0019020F15|nr:pentatricopeptide repeat-containing protein At4g18520, chloroplastic-like [Benincasa hispida]
MLSPAFISTATISHPPPCFSVQPPPTLLTARRTCSKWNFTSIDHCKSSTNFRLNFVKDLSRASPVACIAETFTTQEYANVESCSSQSVSGCLSPYLIAVWLRSSRSAKELRAIHAFILRHITSFEIYVGNNLVSSYLRFGMLVDARKAFDEMPVRNVVTWTTIINGYIHLDFTEEALGLFSDSVKNGVQANGKMFVCILNLCAKRLDFELGRQIHGVIVKGNWGNLIIDSAIVYFYAQCKDISSAFVAFEHMPKRDVVCWTSMITSCSQQGLGREAISLFSNMLNDGFLPNEFSVCSVLKACGEERELKIGRQLHGLIIKKIIKNDVFVGTSLVDMYAKCGNLADSREVFNGMRNRNTVTWTSIIAGYAREGRGEEAVNLFRLMKRQRIPANNLTIVSILRACGSIGASLTGREVHAQIVKSSFQTNIHIGSTLVWFYCKCRNRLKASMVLQLMPLRDVVSWTAIISGCAHLGHESEALEFLKNMVEEGVEPNSFTYSSALKACAKMEAILQGKLIHSSANKTSALSNVFVGSALIYMYAKCGYVTEASQVFDSMPVRNLVSWKAMILCYARNGLCREALKLMYRMQAEGIEVDDYILGTVYGACGDVKCDVDSSLEYRLQTY